ALGLEQARWSFDDWLRALRSLPLQARAAELRAALDRSTAALALATPCRVVLCGVQNAGKSTLMNRLLFQERVLTGPTAGLTRDPVREPVVLAGYPYLLVDTAGEGRVGDALDAAA